MLWRKALSVITFVCYVHTSESIRWPAGTYGIPKPASGCPLADGFQWQEGWRSQDTDGTYSNNAKSAEFHLDGIVDVKKVQRSFCIKTSISDNNNRPDWPAGQYCVYKKGQCPTGLKTGYVYWDDDDFINQNKKEGTLPDGIYDGDTQIYFCCKTDGDKDVPVLLPSKSPFSLLAYKSAKCQMVKWAIATMEWIYYDTEDLRNADEAVDTYPYRAGKSHPTIYYCYYQGCNETLTTINGSFQSPNYPRNYPDGQYCSWRIMVNITQRIHLMFTNFSLQNENNTDVLYVYDGENTTGKVLRVLYGGHPPPQEGIYSSSNKMFLIFKSDESDSYKGFRASYYSVNKSWPSVTTTQTPDLTLLSPLTSKTRYTLESTTFTRNPTSTIDGPTKGGGEEDELKQHRKKGFNVVAVIVPVVLVVFLVAGLIAAFFYCKRKRTKKDAKPDEVMFLARPEEIPVGEKVSNFSDVNINVNITRHDGPEHYMELSKATQSQGRSHGATGTETTSYFSDYAPLHPGTRSWEVPRENVIIEKIIGSGKFGQVAQGKASQLRGRNEATKVAIKMLKDNAPEADKKDLLSELEVMKTLKPHPHVIKLLGCVTDSDPLLVIIECVPYGDLLGYLRKSRGLEDMYYNVEPQSSLTTQQLIKFSWHIADGMNYLSSRNIIHRDLAARNVLVGEHEICKVTDFGMARDVQEENIYERKSKARPIPIKWTAIEGLLHGRYTTKSDVWSFGIVLYEIFTIGGVPYPTIRNKEIPDLLGQGHRMPKPRHVGEALYEIMLSCWQEDPDSRPTFENLTVDLKEMEKQHKKLINMQDYDEKLYENVED